MQSLAQQLPKDLITEHDILAQAFILMSETQGIKTAKYYFYVDQDFASDLITEYRSI